MKIIGIAASPRKNKSSLFLLNKCLDKARNTAESLSQSVETEVISLAGLSIAGCIACDSCKKGLLCSQQDDFQQLIPKLSDPDLVGIIISTPVYLGSMTSQAKAVLDRSVSFRRNGFILSNILGGTIAVGGSRNGGQELTIQAVHAAMMIHGMIIVGDGEHFGGTGWSNHEGGYEADTFGIDTSEKLGKRMAEVAIRMNCQP